VAYGKIATLVAGTPVGSRKRNELMAGIDAEPPRPGAVFDRSSTDWVTYLQAQIRALGAVSHRLDFERPTAWERWLAGRLVEAGGVAESFETPLSPTPGLRVVTAGAQRDAAFAVLRELVAASRPAPIRRASISSRARRSTSTRACSSWRRTGPASTRPRPGSWAVSARITKRRPASPRR
jgi:hypothetical protein